jgi:hypothetical protein
MASWLCLPVEKALDPHQREILRAAVDDPIPEVAFSAWYASCNGDESDEWLLSSLSKAQAVDTFRDRTRVLAHQRWRDPAIIAGTLAYTRDSRNEIRRAAYSEVKNWRDPVPPEITALMRSALTDADPPVRRTVATFLRVHGDADDIGPLMERWRDGVSDVRIAAFKAVGNLVVNPYNGTKKTKDQPRWSEPRIQARLAEYFADRQATFEERMSICRWIADAAAMRRACSSLLVEADALPKFVHSYPDSDGSYQKGWTREAALAHLAVRWTLADVYATTTPDDYYEQDFDLTQSQRLRDGLLACVRQQADHDALMAALRSEIEHGLSYRDGSALADILARLGTTAASLANPLAAQISQMPDSDLRWYLLWALPKLGDDGVGCAVPLLEGMEQNSATHERAERMLKELKRE